MKKDLLETIVMLGVLFLLIYCAIFSYNERVKDYSTFLGNIFVSSSNNNSSFNLKNLIYNFTKNIKEDEEKENIKPVNKNRIYKPSYVKSNEFIQNNNLNIKPEILKPLPTVTPEFIIKPTPTIKPKPTSSVKPTPTVKPTPEITGPEMIPIEPNEPIDKNSPSNLKTNKFIINNPNGKFMPDRYNTGLDRRIPLTYYDLDTIKSINGIRFVRSSAMSGNKTVEVAVINNYSNTDLSGTYVIENYDFTKYYVRVYNFVNLKQKAKIIFKNCKFDGLNTADILGDNMSIELINCDLKHFSGSNTLIRNCKFGDSGGDAINAFQNVTVKDSYIANLSVYSDNLVHADGVQIYARKNVPAINIHFYNTRFEVPCLVECRNGKCSNSYVNAPLMLQLEYNNGDNITFENLHINGGGYSIYSIAIHGFKYTNVLFKNIDVGYGSLFGVMHPNKGKEGLTMENVKRTEKLLIGSIWKDRKGVHISTTNHMLEERELTCVTNVGTFKFKVKAHPKITRETNKNLTFNDMPYDIDNLINYKNIKWVKCYDTTNDKELNNNNFLIEHNF